MSFHWQAFAKTVVLSFFLVVPCYNFVYYLANWTAKAEILGTMDVGMTSDNLKRSIVEFNRRKATGENETFDNSELRQILGEGLRDNKGLSKQKVEEPAYQNFSPRRGRGGPQNYL